MTTRPVTSTPLARRSLLAAGALGAAAVGTEALTGTAHASDRYRRPLRGKVAFVTGAGRGVGRAAAVDLARAGADVLVLDIGRDISSVPYGLATDADLRETAKQVRRAGGRCVAVTADVRDLAAMEKAAARCVAELGRIDVVVANAAVLSFGSLTELSEQAWHDVMDVNLTGAAWTIRAALPHLRKQGTGSIIAVGSAESRAGGSSVAHYISSKWGLIGLVKCLAYELNDTTITVNGINPTVIRTPMVLNDAAFAWAGVEDEAGLEQAMNDYFHLMDAGIIEPEDCSRLITFLASPGARYISGTFVDIAAGASARWSA